MVDGFFVADAPPRRPARNPLLLSDALDADTFERVHVTTAARGSNYRCPFANCLGPVYVKDGCCRRRHFAHAKHSDCINPSSLHDKAIGWLQAEGAIEIRRTELTDNELANGAIFAGVVRTEAKFGMAWRGKKRQRRSDAEVCCDDQVLAVEFVRTHDLRGSKCDDYREYAAELALQGKRLSLLIVHLTVSIQDFYKRTEKEWRDFVLFDAPRRLIHVPVQSN